jgi:P63C domain
MRSIDFDSLFLPKQGVSMTTDDLSQHAKVLSAKGASKGGYARAKSLTPEERKEIAQNAAETRWSSTVPKATHTGSLDIAGRKFSCAVLENGTRLLTQRDFLTAIGRSSKPTSKKKTARALQAADPPPFFVAENLRPFVSDELLAKSNPIAFRGVRGQRSLGYEATLLAEVCEAYLKARDAHKDSILINNKRILTEDQERIADFCDVLMRGFAQVGIVALIDEATGYQAQRENDELNRILSLYVEEMYRPYITTRKPFTPEFFQHIYRLYHWKYDPNNTQSPRYIGKLINKWIYEQLPPNVLPKLQEKNPVNEKGRRKYKHFQFLTVDIGEPHLEKQIVSMITLMRISSTKEELERYFNKAFGKPYQDELPLE